MNNGTNNFQNFIGISSLQKTLRNALIPTETTQQFIVKNGIIKEDELRGENRQILKDIMDDYYRGFISETLSSIDDIDWTSLFEKMEIQLKNGDNKDNFACGSTGYYRTFTYIQQCSFNTSRKAYKYRYN